MAAAVMIIGTVYRALSRARWDGGDAEHFRAHTHVMPLALGAQYQEPMLGNFASIILPNPLHVMEKRIQMALNTFSYLFSTDTPGGR